MELVGPLIILFSFPAIIAWAIWYSRQRNKKLAAGLEIVSQQLGLQIVPAKKNFWNSNHPHLSGNYKGASMRIVPREVKQGKSVQFFTDFIMDCHNPKNMKFLIEPEGILNAIGDLIGFGDTKIGDQQFDDRFRIKAEKSNHLLSLLDSASRNKLYSLWEARDWNATLKLEGNSLIYTEEGFIGINDIELRAQNISESLLVLQNRMEMIDWEDSSGASFWDENQAGNEEMVQ